LAFRDVALEISIFKRVIFGPNGQTTDGGVQGGDVGDGPALEHAIGFQTEVIVQAPGVVLLDDKDGLLVGLGGLG